MRFIFSPISAIFLTGIVGIICLSLYFTSQRIKQSSTSVALLEAEVAEIEAKANQIEKKAVIATSSTAKEQLIREELLMQRPNEFIVQIPDIEVETTKIEQDAESLSPWEQWKQLLF